MLFEVGNVKKINMLSSADKVKGQGVGAAYIEQVNLVKEGLKYDYDVMINSKANSEIAHYHTIDLKHYFHSLFGKNKRISVGYVHFLPETIEGSLRLPIGVKEIFYKYIIMFYKNMDYLVTVNPYFIDKLEEYGIDKNKIFYIPNYVSAKMFHVIGKEDIRTIKKEYNVDIDKFVVLGVGQVQTRKGVKDFVKVAEMNPDMEFIWAGGASFGVITDGYDELKEVVENPPKNVKFLGIIDRKKMNDVYNMADLMFLPSYNELFPMTVLESMNCEKPMLLRDLSIYRNILKDYYLKGNDNEEFSDIIRKLKNDPAKYESARKLSKRGAKFYSRDYVLELWKDFYDKIISKGNNKYEKQ